MQPVEAAGLMQRIEAGDAPLIVDVRGAGEFAQGHVPGAINIPHGDMGVRAGEIEDLLGDKERPVLLYCQSGRRAGLAARELRKQGFTDIHHLKGDMPGWIRDGYPVEKN